MLKQFKTCEQIADYTGIDPYTIIRYAQSLGIRTKQVRLADEIRILKTLKEAFKTPTIESFEIYESIMNYA